jgi:sugar fermentation stimulation protein A
MKFDSVLREGLIVGRPNRFLMNVVVDGTLELCHCPSTGRIGCAVFNEVPCLLSESKDGKNRRTKYTVEAISFNGVKNPHKKWIGINQTKANNYVDYFLRRGQLKEMVNTRTKSATILREQRIGDSRIDFVINGDIYLEVKTPLVLLPLKDSYITSEAMEFREHKRFYAFDRFFKHLEELSRHKRAILMSFYMFEADKFIPEVDESDSTDRKIRDVVLKTRDSGVEFWQVNTKFTDREIRLVDYYRMSVDM